MDNQHKLIKGYRDLNQNEIDLMNEVKAKAQEVEKLLLKIETGQLSECEANDSGISAYSIDMRWLNIGKTDLQKGFMALVRAIAKPEAF